jgi:hypothetical protein
MAFDANGAFNSAFDPVTGRLNITSVTGATPAEARDLNGAVKAALADGALRVVRV